MKHNIIELGDCYEILSKAESNTVDLIYLDPPFFTQKDHILTTKDGDKKLSFRDKWSDIKDYLKFMFDRLSESHRVLKETGSMFLHCDRSAVHRLKLICDEIFGELNFKSEIVWTYKRWSNSSSNLMPAHQNILYYTKSKNFVFNQMFADYSKTTNIDQILQNRTRDRRNKSVYAKDKHGDIIQSESKKGVPLSDVWEIPYLNPKAKERVGYPTQKPIMLLERIISLSSKEGDLVLDPFCGSGTTLVAAKLLGRRYWGIDVSEDAVSISNMRVEECVRTESDLMKKGRDAYDNSDKRIESILTHIGYKVVHRNKGIDAVLNEKVDGGFVFVRLQKEGEPIENGLNMLRKAMFNKGKCKGIFIAFDHHGYCTDLPQNIQVIYSVSAQVMKAIGVCDILSPRLVI